ncbi:MAG: glycosyltransferase 87 family protein [Anaerolineae bacterium]
MTGSSDILVFNLIWLSLCVTAYYLLPRDRLLSSRFISARALFVVLLIGLLARLIPAATLLRGAEYDIESFRRVGEVFLQGQAIYSSPLVSGRHPYLPFQVYLIGAAIWISQKSGLPFAFTVKLPSIVADLGLIALIFRIVQKSGKSIEQAMTLGLLYALNPVSILVSAYHGQFDALPALLLALAWNCLSKPGLSALFLGLAVVDKTWPILFLPIALMRLDSFRRQVLYCSIAVAIPVLLTTAYLVAFPEDAVPLVRRALTHSGVPGWWGGSAILNILTGGTEWGQRALGLLGNYGRWLVLGCVGLSYWLTRKESTIAALVTAILTLYVFTPGFGLQWLLWVVPFAILAEDVGMLNKYVVGALLYMVPSYFGYHLDTTLTALLSSPRMMVIMQVCGIPGWLITVVWLIKRLRMKGCAL